MSMTSPLVRPIAFTEFDLENGLHVIIHEDHDAPIVSISVWYHVGSRDEELGRTGFAHLFEHMMFQGSTNVKKQEHFKYIQDVGGTLNATTSADRTNYFQTLPSQYLALGLWLESDRMRSLEVTQENFENQRDVVKEERRQRYENAPYGSFFERLLAAAYSTSGYRWPTIGSVEDLNAASIEDVRAFHAKYYIPNNATLVLSGDVDPKEARTLIEQYFSDIPRGNSIDHAEVHEPAIAGPVRVSVEDEVPHPLVAIAFHAPAETHADATAMEFLAEMLAGGESSPLHRRLVYIDRIAPHVSAHPIMFESTGMLAIEALVAPGQTPEHVEQVLWEELAAFRSAAPENRMLEKARNSLYHSLVDRHNSVLQLSQALSQAYVYFNNTSHVNEAWNETASVTSEDVHRLAQQLVPEKSIVITMLPKQ